MPALQSGQFIIRRQRAPSLDISQTALHIR